MTVRIIVVRTTTRGFELARCVSLTSGHHHCRVSCPTYNRVGGNSVIGQGICGYASCDDLSRSTNSATCLLCYAQTVAAYSVSGVRGSIHHHDRKRSFVSVYVWEVDKTPPSYDKNLLKSPNEFEICTTW